MKNIIDKILEPFVPQMVANRLRARYLIQAYEATKVTRTHKAKGQHLSADASIQQGRARCASSRASSTKTTI